MIRLKCLHEFHQKYLYYNNDQCICCKATIEGRKSNFSSFTLNYVNITIIEFFINLRLDKFILHKSCHYNNLEVIRYLVEKGYSLTEKNDQNQTPLEV